MFSVSSILECPKYLATNVMLAPLSINNDAQLCLKSCTLISLTPALKAFLVFLSLNVVSGNGSTSPKTYQLSLKL